MIHDAIILLMGLATGAYLALAFVQIDRWKRGHEQEKRDAILRRAAWNRGQ